MIKICNTFITLTAIFFLSSCGGGGGNTTINSPQADAPTNTDTGSNGEFKVVSARIYDAPVDNGVIQLTATETPANFSVAWEITPAGKNLIYRAKLYLSRNDVVDASDELLSSVTCSNYENNAFHCGISNNYLCNYNVSDTVRCMDESLDDDDYIDDYLRDTGDWPWQGNLILEFCQSGLDSGCIYSDAFAVKLDKSTEKNHTGNSAAKTKTYANMQLPGRYNVALNNIRLNSQFDANDVMVLQAAGEQSQFSFTWDQVNSYQELRILLSTDNTESDNDIQIFRDSYFTNDTTRVDCKFDVLNYFICDGKKSKHLVDYFQNSGNMPWQGFLLFRVKDASENLVSTQQIAVPVALQF